MSKKFIIFILVLVYSCKSKEKLFISRTGEQKITIKNDSIINYRASEGGEYGVTIEYRYKKIKRMIKIQKNYSDTLTHLKNISNYDIKNINNQIFTKTKDSLVNTENGIIFYSEKYFEKNEIKRTVYYVIDNKKYKVTPNKQNETIMSKINLDDYELNVMDKELALKE